MGGDVISLGSVAWEDRAARDLTLNDLRHFHPGLPMSPRAHGDTLNLSGQLQRIVTQPSF